MSTPAEATSKLHEYATELDQLSKSLAKVEREIEPLDEQYSKALEDAEAGMWQRSQEDNEKLPSEAMRGILARRSMDQQLLGRRSQLLASRKRMEQRIRDLKALVEAQRSIVSALKMEMEASA